MKSSLVLLDYIDHTISVPIVKQMTSEFREKLLPRLTDDKLVVINTTLNEDVDEKIYNNKAGISILTVEYTKEPNQEFAIASSTYGEYDKYRPILMDTISGFKVEPIYQPYDYTVKFVYKDKSKTSLVRFKERLLAQYQHSGFTFKTDVDYTYALPKVLLSLMTEINDKLIDGGVARTLKEYIESITTTKLDYLTLRGSDYELPSFRGKLLNVVILPDNSDSPAATEIEKDDIYYTYEFGIKFIAYIPNSLKVAIPIVVNNKPMTDRWFGQSSVMVPADDGFKIDFDSISAVFMKLNNYRTTGDVLFHYPTYDSFYPNINTIVNDLVRFLSVLLIVDENDTGLVVSMSDLAELGVSSVILDYIRAQDKINHYIHSCIFLEIYEHAMIKDHELYYDSATDSIRVRIGLDKMQINHVLITMHTNLDYLADKTNLDQHIDMLNELGIEYQYTGATAVGRKNAP